MVLMCKEMKFSREIELWMKDFYDYSSSNEKAENYECFKDLKDIVERMKSKEV